MKSTRQAKNKNKYRKIILICIISGIGLTGLAGLVGWYYMKYTAEQERKRVLNNFTNLLADKLADK
jgi:hypothetical protein